MSIVVGIDLGTSNSVVATKGMSVRVLKNKEGDDLTPSSVTFLPPAFGGDILVGRPSIHMAKQHPESTVRSIKRLMGHEFEDSQIASIIAAGKLTYPLITEPSEPGSIRVKLHGKTHSPEEISSYILKKVLHDAGELVEGEIDRAVVTVPAYFSDRQKFATRAACQQAGIKLLRLLSEPTAAALSFGLGEMDADESKAVMVFDLGGGTFDVSILNIANGQFLEVSKGGDMWLGGDDVDQLLMEKCLKETERANPDFNAQESIASLSAESKARFLLELKESCEKAKIKLSTQTSAAVEVYGLKTTTGSAKAVDVDVEISREELNTLLAPLAERLKIITMETLQGIGYEIELIDTVVMVGGSSAIPLFQDTMKKLFGENKVRVHPRPMLAIAEGAAIMAHKLASKNETAVAVQNDVQGILHSASHSYYLQLAEGKRTLLMERNSPLPYVHEEVLEFQHEAQKLARFRVLNEVDGLLETVGEMWLYRDGDEPVEEFSSHKKISVKLKFEIDEDNIITLNVTSLQEGAFAGKENTISRGGLAVKLRNDVEEILTQAHVHNGAGRGSALLQLSKIPNRTIAEMTNPYTGVLSASQKQLATLQVEVLRQLSQEKRNCFSVIFDAKALLDLIGSELSPERKKTFENLIDDAKKEMQMFTNAKSYTAAASKLLDYLNETFKPEIISVLSFIISSQNRFANDVAKLQKLVKEFTARERLKDTNGLKATSSAIWDILYQYTSEAVAQSQTFHRDVVRANI